MARNRVYWDSCLFLAIVNEEAGRADVCANLFKEAAVERKAQIYTSAITVAECAVVQGSEEHDETIRRYFEHSCVTVVNADRLVAERARELQRRAYADLGRKLPVRDSIHLATALRVNAEVLLTYDNDDLLPLSGNFAGRSGIYLKIQEPFWEGPQRLL